MTPVARYLPITLPNTLFYRSHTECRFHFPAAPVMGRVVRYGRKLGLWAVACAMVLSTNLGTTSAQALPLSLRVSSPFALSLRVHSGLALTTANTRSPRSEQHRAGWMLASGAGLLVGGVAHAATFGREGVCYERERRLATPQITGGLVAGVGFALVLGGGIKLFNVPGDYRSHQPVSPGKRAGMVFTAVGIAALTQAVLFLPIIGEYIGCISS